MSRASSDIDLMLHHDGELSEREAAEVAGRLESDPDARTKVEAIDQVGEAVRTHLELAADEAEPALDALWDGIERRIGANGAADDSAMPAPRRRPAAEEGRGLLGAVAAWFDRHRGHFVTGAVTAGAVAAIMLLMRPEPGVTEKVVVKETSPAATSPVVQQSTPPEIEYLEVNDGSGTVLELPSAQEDEAGATVIWVSPDESNVEGPI